MIDVNSMGLTPVEEAISSLTLHTGPRACDFMQHVTAWQRKLGDDK